MFAVIAALLFAIAFIINAAHTAVDPILSPTSLLLAGLVFLALHHAGIGPAFSYRRRRP
jgi:hypothetical protein